MEPRWLKKLNRISKVYFAMVTSPKFLCVEQDSDIFVISSSCNLHKHAS